MLSRERQHIVFARRNRTVKNSVSMKHATACWDLRWTSFWYLFQHYKLRLKNGNSMMKLCYETDTLLWITYKTVGFYQKIFMYLNALSEHYSEVSVTTIEILVYQCHLWNIIAFLTIKWKLQGCQSMKVAAMLVHCWVGFRLLQY